MSELRSVSSDAVLSREALFRELTDLLESGFTGNVTLHCLAGEVRKYVIELHRIPGRTSGTDDKQVA